MEKNKTEQKFMEKPLTNKSGDAQGISGKGSNPDREISNEQNVKSSKSDAAKTNGGNTQKIVEKKEGVNKVPMGYTKIFDQFNAKLNLANRLNARPCLAIDIDNDQITYISAKKSGRNIQVEKCGIQPLDPSIDRFKAIQLALTNLQSKINKHGMKVYVSFYSPDINIRQIIIPKTKKKTDLESAIFFKNQSDLPNFNNESIWNYQILEEFSEEDVKKLRILVITIPAKVVQMYMEIFLSVGLRLEKLVPRPIAVETAYNAMIPETDNDLVVVISNFFTQIFNFRNGRLQFFRNAAFGVSNIQKKAEEKNDDSLPMNNDLRKVVKENELHNTGGSSTLKERLLEKVKEGKTEENSVIKMLHSEIKRSIEYINNTFPNEKVRRIFVTGSGIQLEEITTYLQEQFHDSIILLKPQFSSSEINTNRYGEYFTALGTSLQTGKEFDTIPATYKSSQVYKNANILLMTILFLSIAGAFSFSSYQNYEFIKSQNILAQLGQQYQLLNPVQTKYDDMVLKYNGVQNDANKLLGFVKKTPQVLEALRLFSNETPPFIILNEMNVEEYIPPRSSKKGKGSPEAQYKYQVTLTGQIKSNFQMGDVVLINFMNHLNDLKYFKDIKLTNKRKEIDKDVFEFWLQLFL